MPEMQYNTDDLRTAATHATSASQSAQQAAAALRGAAPGASPFGDVNGADALHGAVGVAHAHHVTGATNASQNLGVASQRAGGAASLGDDNTAETTRLAPRSDKAAGVSQGM